MGIYFEIYGADADEPLRISVSALPMHRSLLGRITDALGFTSQVSTRATWEEAPGTPGAGFTPRYLGVDLGTLDSGEHSLTLRVERADGTVATSSRRIRIGG
jgi:hypothetical protein